MCGNEQKCAKIKKGENILDEVAVVGRKCSLIRKKY